MMYGREREKEEIENILRDVEENNRGRVIFIEGELGTGKTLLINEIAGICKQMGYIVMIGGCIGADAADPFLPYIEAINSSKDSMPNIYYYDVKRIETERSIESVAGFILDLTDVGKVFMAIDDVHNAHPTALRLLTYLGIHAAEKPIVIMATYRPEELYESDEYIHALSETIRKLSRERNMTHIQIKNLDENSCEKMMRDFFEINEIPSKIKKTVISKSGGNPYFLIEMCKILEDSGVYQRDEKKFIEEFTDNDVPLPDEITGIVLSRLAGLEENVMKVLEYAAVYGDKINEDVLQQTLDMDDEEFVECIEKIINHCIFIEIDDEQYHYKFAQSFIRTAIYERMSRARRKLIHGKIGRAIENIYLDKTDKVVYELAHHFKNSRNIKKALHYLMQSGDTAEKGGAYREAMSYYEESLGVIEWMDETRANLEKKRDILEALGRINHFMVNISDAMKYMESAAEISKKLNDDVRLLNELLEMIKMCERTSKWDDADKLSKEALSIAKEVGSPLYLLACYREMGYISWRKGEMKKSEDYYRKGQEEIPHIGKSKDVAELYINIGNLLLDLYRLDEAEKYYKMALDYFKENDDMYNIPRIMNNLGALEFRRKNLDLSLQMYENGMDYSRKVGNKIVLAYLLSGASSVYALKGDIKKAEECIKNSMKLTNEIGDEHLSAVNVFRKGIICQCRDEHKDAMRLFNESIKLLSKHGAYSIINMVRIEAAKSAVKIGDINGAKRLLHEAREWYKLIDAKSMVDEINIHLGNNGGGE